MNISYKWLQQFTPVDVDEKTFVHQMCMTGTEVTGYTLSLIHIWKPVKIPKNRYAEPEKKFHQNGRLIKYKVFRPCRFALSHCSYDLSSRHNTARFAGAVLPKTRRTLCLLYTSRCV